MNKSLFKLFLALPVLAAAAGSASAFEPDSLVWRKCTHCHHPENEKIPRVEEVRTTPEEWTVIIDRMHRLYGMDLDAAEMAALLKELCATQILSPAEAARVAYINLFNNPQTVETPDGADEERLFATCVRCHSAAKIYSYRMSESSWQKLREFHLYIDPAIISQMREMHWREEAAGVLDYLARELPYDSAWEAPQERPGVDWLVLGNEPGKGSYRGTATLNPAGDDEYAVQGKLQYSDGTVETFSGAATLYGGYALRTRTRHNGSETMGAFSFQNGTISGEHHHRAPNFRTSSSTWYPATGSSRVLRLTPGYLLSGEETSLLIEGIALPQARAQDVAISGADIRVLEARTISPEAVELTLEYGGTDHGQASVSVAGLEAGTLQLAPRIGYLSVTPATGRARVDGGVHHPAEGVQFQAIAYASGADAVDPSDDVALGPVDAVFNLAEAVTRPGDDDLVHLGAIGANGSYIPSSDYGPIVAREFRAEGTGLVRVIAVYTRGDTEYAAEGQLVVTVPDYVQRLK